MRELRAATLLTPTERRKWRAYIRENTRIAHDTGCWVWQMSPTKEGYGQASRAFEHGYDVLAHRLAHVMYIGPVPAGKIVRHLCHNRMCCNPKHIEAGTYKDNTDDNRRDARPIGRERLTPEDVLEIRRLLKTHTQRALGLRYAVDASTIGAIARGKNWNHVK